MSGRVEAIWSKRSHGGVMDPARDVIAVEGKGLEGDANFGATRQVTVIEKEVFDRILAELPGADPAMRRANIMVSGIRLEETRDHILTVGDVQIVTRLIEGEYPNYRGLIPDDHPNSLVVERDDMLDALRRVRLLATDNTPVRLVMSSDGLELIAITQDIGQAQETVDARYEGEDLTVAFNPTFLIQGLEVCPDEELRLETCDALKPAVIRGMEDSNFLYLLMPVRVS